MKIEDNRALVAKKKLYNQPEVNIAQIGTMSIICASGSGGGLEGCRIPGACKRGGRRGRGSRVSGVAAAPRRPAR